jgi:hypothetical protein
MPSNWSSGGSGSTARWTELAAHNCLVGGSSPRRQLCPCQKHPWTNTATPNRGKMISGLPGKSRLCKRNRKPDLTNTVRTAFSGRVFLPRTAAIILDRTSDVTLSIIQMDILGDDHIPVEPESNAQSRSSARKTTNSCSWKVTPLHD